MQKFFLAFLILAVVIGSCVSHDLVSFTCPITTELSFANDVSPIVNSKCAIPGCHVASSMPDRDWTDFSMFQKRALNGEVKRRVVNHIMPPPSSPNGPLTQEQINIIACWADQGAKKN